MDWKWPPTVKRINSNSALVTLSYGRPGEDDQHCTAVVRVEAPQELDDAAIYQRAFERLHDLANDGMNDPRLASD